MITGLLIILVVFEAVRLSLNIKDSRRISKINKHASEQQGKALEFAREQNTAWMKIRELEIEELKQLAKESDTMKQIYDEWIESHKGER